MYNIEEIRENYKGFSDSKIENIAKKESKGLKKEVVEILKEEIEKRNLDKNLISWVETETKTFDGIERESLIKKIQHLNCPKCSEKKDRLYGFEINKVMSFLLLTFISRKEKVLCKSCGKKEKLKAIIITFFTGWWSVNGFLKTFWVVIMDTTNFLYLDKISQKILKRIVDENTGYFRRKGTENGTLNQLIKKRNEKEIMEDEGYDFV